MSSWRRSKSGRMKSSMWRKLENCEEFISLTPKTRNSKKPSRILARNWKHQWLPLCLARSARTIRIVGVVHSKPKQSLRVFWKPVNLQDCVWENLYRIIMKTILQEKETIHCRIIIWFTNLFPCPKPWKFPKQRQQWTRNGKHWRTFRRGTWRKSEVRKRWSMKHGRRAQKFISPHWWHVAFEKCWVGGKASKIQRSNCTPRWYCEDDSGSYAVFTEQGSSASQMTAAKVMDFISRLPRMCRTSSGRSICLDPCKMEDARNLFKIPKS